MYLRVVFRFLARLRTWPVPYFLSWKEESFFVPSSYRPSFFASSSPSAGVCLAPKFLPDERGVAHGKDHRCQLRGTGSWRLISSSDHSRMNRSTWATMLTVLLWMAGYERMANVVYSWNLFFFYLHVSNVCCTENQLFYQLIFADKDEQKRDR